MSCPDMPALGVYVLGAVDDDERATIEAHVEACAECRQELARLVPLPRYLARLSPGEVAALDQAARPPAGLLTRLRAAQSTSRRRLIRQRIAVAAAVAIALAAGLAIRDDAPRPVPAARASAMDAGTGVKAAVVVAPRAWGTEVGVRMSGATPGERCRLVVTARDGRSEVAATWRATYLGTAGVTGSAAIALADVTSVDVMTSAGRRLVHVPIPAQTTQEDAS